MRRGLSALLLSLARGSQGVATFFGGLSLLGFAVSLVMLVFNPKHGAAHYGDLTVRRWLWVFPAIAIGAWLIGYRWIPSLLTRIAVAVLPEEDRFLLAAAIASSLDTGEPMPSLAELRRVRDAYLAPDAASVD